MYLFIKGYVNANGIEAKAIVIVKLLKLIKTKKAIEQSAAAYVNPRDTDIFPDAIGLFLVLDTFLSNFLSKISFIIQPADLIRTEPAKKSIA